MLVVVEVDVEAVEVEEVEVLVEVVEVEFNVDVVNTDVLVEDVDAVLVEVEVDVMLVEVEEVDELDANEFADRYASWKIGKASKDSNTTGSNVANSLPSIINIATHNNKFISLIAHY